MTEEEIRGELGKRFEIVRLREFYLDPVPVPIGAEIYRITAAGTDFIARFDGQVWQRPAGAG